MRTTAADARARVLLERRRDRDSERVDVRHLGLSSHLTAANREKILASERYTTRASAEGDIAAVKANAGIDARYERREARDGQVYFVLKAANGEIVGVSETYTSASALQGGIESVKLNAAAAGVEG